MSAPLVILDCDGVLVDSERITNTLLAEMATELGWPTSFEDSIRRFKGRDLHLVRDDIAAHLGIELDDAFITGYRTRMATRFETEGVPPVPGAPDLLDRLDQSGVHHVVASNGPHTKMRMTMGTIDTDRWPGGWYERFEGRRFSAYDVDRWKPDPGLFLHAATRMGTDIDRCVVIEDSPSGVKAARAAGMRVIGLANLTDADALGAAGATEVCDEMREADEILTRWLA